MNTTPTLFSFLNQYGRLFIYFFLFLFVLLFQLGIQSITSSSILLHFYFVVTIGALIQLVFFFWNGNFQRPGQLYLWSQGLSFFVDLCLLTYLNFKFNINTPLFFFLSLFLVFLSGLRLSEKLFLVFTFFVSATFLLQSWLQEEYKSSVYFSQILFYLVGFWGISYFSLKMKEIFESQNSNFDFLKNLNELIVESMPTGLLLIQKDGTIQLANKKIEDYFSWKQQSDKVFEYFPSLLKDWSKTQFPFEKEIKFKKDSSQYFLKIAIHPVFNEQFLILISDLTEVKKLEEQLRQSEKMSAIGQLAAGIAHEIRNPLTGISGSLELLSPQTFSEEDQKLKKIILKEIGRLNQLISDFLNYAKPDQPPQNEMNLKPTLEAVVFNLQQSLTPKNLILQSKLTEVTAIIGDEDKLKQVFLNFIKNAIEACEKTVNPLVLIQLSEDQHHVIVSVQDNGEGMSEEAKKKMFDPFFTTKHHGTGLGLAMTYKILETHQAKVQVESQLGHGTEIKVFFKKNQ